MGRMTSRSISFKTTPVTRISSYGQVLSCPVCERTLMLKDIRDGDQAYWCHTCERGWRAGHLPPEARRAKAKALLEESLEVMPIPEPEIVVPVKKSRQVSLKSKIAEPKSRAKPVGAPLKPVLLEPEVSLKTKVTRVAKAKTTPEAVILETSPVIIPAPKKTRTPKAAVPVAPEAIVPVVLAQPEPVIPEVKKQKSRASPQTVKHTNTVVQQDLFAYLIQHGSS